MLADLVCLAMFVVLDAPAPAERVAFVLHDAFGALTVPLADRSPTVVVDSYCSAVAIRENLGRHGVDGAAVRVCTPLDELDEPISLLVVRPPRNLALLEHLLRSVRPLLDAGSDAAALVRRAGIEIAMDGMEFTL